MSQGSTTKPQQHQLASCLSRYVQGITGGGGRTVFFAMGEKKAAYKAIIDQTIFFFLSAVIKVSKMLLISSCLAYFLF